MGQTESTGRERAARRGGRTPPKMARKATCWHPRMSDFSVYLVNRGGTRAAIPAFVFKSQSGSLSRSSQHRQKEFCVDLKKKAERVILYALTH